MSYGARQAMLDEDNAEHGLHRYWRSAFTEQISDELIGIMVAGAARFSSPPTTGWPLGPGRRW
jgi:hypothetical protein